MEVITTNCIIITLSMEHQKTLLKCSNDRHTLWLPVGGFTPYENLT